MTTRLTAPKWSFRLPILAALLVSLAACAGTPNGSAPTEMHFAAPQARSTGIDPKRRDVAVALAQQMRAHGKRVWCVPFARNVSGIDLRGNARTWWSQAEGLYERGHTPKVGAVMAFSATRGMPLGHVAVVSSVVSEREIRIDHANWRRNQVSLGMSVIDVSEHNDWSRVRVNGNAGGGSSVYPVAGFISNPAQNRS